MHKYHTGYVRELIHVGKKKIKIVFEGEAPICLYRGEVRQFDIAVDCEIAPETMEQIYTEVLPKRAKSRALHLLEKKDYTCFQMKKKLREGCYPEEVISDTISYLQAHCFLDDARYAENYLRVHGATDSRRKLQQKLTERGIPRDIIAAQMEEMEAPCEREQVEHLLEKKRYHHDAADRKAQDKMLRFLMARGYAFNLAMECMKATENKGIL